MVTLAEMIKEQETQRMERNLTFRCGNCGQPPSTVSVTTEPMMKRISWVAYCCSQKRTGELTKSDRAHITAGLPIEVTISPPGETI